MVTQGLPAAPQAPPLRIAVVNGHLAWVRECLLVGHYRSSVLTGTEAVVDGLTGGMLRSALGLGVYPEGRGSQQVFINRHRDPDNPWLDARPSAAVVVGLGDEGRLSGGALAVAVGAAVLAWVSEVRIRAPNQAGGLALASTLMGSGSAAFSPADSARAVAIGLRDANRKLAQGGWPVIDRLTLIELYTDRCVDAWYGLSVLQQSAPHDFDLAPTIESGTGALRRPLATGYRGTDADLLSVSVAGEGAIAFSLHTDRAATVVGAVTTRAELSRKLVEHEDVDGRETLQFRRMLQALVPPDVAPFLAGTRRLLLEVDAGTAGLPWELLDTDRHEPDPRNDIRPWSLRTRLLRRFRTDAHRRLVQVDEPDSAALVIGEPATDPQRHAPLPGARAEAKAVSRLLAGEESLGPDRVVSLVDGADAARVVSALYERPYRIVHLAGHIARVSPGGIVLSGDAVLGAAEFAQMRTLPELVFVNGAHVAAWPTLAGDGPGTNAQLAEAAQRLAQSLLEAGVRCVVVAGWRVDEAPACDFAVTLYRALSRGQAFADAVGAAREAAWHADPEGFTWGAYQCYGDPHWRLRRAGTDEPQPREPDRMPPEYGGVTSPMQLVVALDAVAVGMKFQRVDTRLQADRLRHLEAHFGARWGHLGTVAEAFGVAWANFGEPAPAIAWFERAVGAADRSATMKSQEQLANLRIRQAWARAQKGASTAEGDAARDAILRAVEELARLVAQSPTVELMSLCGNAWRRLATLELQRGHAGSAHAAFQQARAHFAAAAAAAGQRELYYPGLNRIALDLMLALDRPAGARPTARIASADFDAVRRSLQRALDEAPDFHGHAGMVELRVYQAVSQRAMAEERAALQAAYSQLHERVASPALWTGAASSVLQVLARYRARAAGKERAAAQALERLLQDFAGAAAAPVPAAPDVADVVIWHGLRDTERAHRLASRLAGHGLDAWLVAESASPADSTRDAELHYRMERARACVLVFRLDGEAPGRAVQHDWQQLLVAMERRSAAAVKPVLSSWTAGDGELPPFLRDHPRFSEPDEDEAAAAAGIARLLQGRRNKRPEVPR